MRLTAGTKVNRLVMEEETAKWVDFLEVIEEHHPKADNRAWIREVRIFIRNDHLDHVVIQLYKMT